MADVVSTDRLGPSRFPLYRTLLDIVQEINTGFFNLSGQASNFSAWIAALSGWVSNVSGWVSNLSGWIMALSGQASTFDGQITTLEGQTSTASGLLDKLVGAVAETVGASGLALNLNIFRTNLTATASGDCSMVVSAGEIGQRKAVAITDLGSVNTLVLLPDAGTTLQNLAGSGVSSIYLSQASHGAMLMAMPGDFWCVLGASGSVNDGG